MSSSRSRFIVHCVESLESRRLFATVSWAQPVDGSFSDPTKWSSGAVPGPGDQDVVNAVGSYKVTLTSNVSVDSLTLGTGADNGPWLEVDGASITATSVVVNRLSMLILRSAALTAPGGVTVNEELDIFGQSAVYANLDFNGHIEVAQSGNVVGGIITTQPGSTIALNPGIGPAADLTVSTGFVVNGVLALNSTVGNVATLKVADGTAVVIQRNPQVDGEDQGVLSGGGQLNAPVINNGTVAPDVNGVALSVNGSYTQASTATLSEYLGRAGDDFYPSLLQIGGDATLGGTLQLRALGVSAKNKLPKGHTDTLITYSSESGAFSRLQGLNLRPSIGPTSMTVTAGHSGPPAINLPSDLVVAVEANKSAKPLVSGAKGSASVGVVNIGLGSATGNVTITLYASTDNLLDPADPQIGSPSTISVHLKTRGMKIVRLIFSYPTLAPGDYYLIATIAATLNIPEADTTNDVNASAKTFRID